jgi:hypothetical protein
MFRNEEINTKTFLTAGNSTATASDVVFAS